MKNYILLSIILLCSVCSIAKERPERLLGGYSGYFLGNNPQKVIEELFIPMRNANFNMVELKIQQKKSKRMDVKTFENEFYILANGAKDNGLWFQIYLYPEPYDGSRRPAWKEHESLPSLVDSKGARHDNTFALLDYNVWKETFKHGYDIAKLSQTLPIGALKFDIETISDVAISYDDFSWNLFTQKHKDFSVDTPSKERAKTLKEKNALELYQDFFIKEFDNVVIQLEKDFHEINPKLSLGVMPATHGWMSDAFIRLLGTPEAPAIIDDWSMYNGEGFNDEVLKKQAKIKGKNPNNIYIPWFRINSYSTEYIASNAYHAGTKCDGYSNWTMYMLQDKPNVSNMYKLPENNKSATYFENYKKANIAIKKDIKENTLDNPQQIKLQAVKSLVPPLDFSKINFPKEDLVPQGNGSYANSQRIFTVRDQTIIFIYANAGGFIEATLKHMAGKSRPISLQYAVLDKDKNILRNEAIQPSAEETFKVRAPYTGIYALVTSGGLSGQAWYSVNILNPYYAFDASKGMYFFGVPLSIYVDAKTLNFNSRSKQAFSYKINNGESVNISANNLYTIKLPDGLTKFSVNKPQPLIKGFYTQDITLTPKGGANPLLFASPERMLIVK